MDQHLIEIITVKNKNSTEIEEPAGAAVGEAFNAHDGSKEAHSGSQPQNLNYTSVAQEVQKVDKVDTSLETEMRTLAEVKGLEPTKINLWKVAFEQFSERLTTIQNRIDKREEEIRSVKNEIYQVVGFFSAFQGLPITAAAQSILLRCNNVGFILALSAFATAVAVFGIWQKITAMEELRSANMRDKKFVMRYKIWRKYLEQRGRDFAFHFFSNYPAFPDHRRPWWKEILVSYRTWLLVSVIAFGGLSMVAMRQIVCNPGHSLPSN